MYYLENCNQTLKKGELWRSLAASKHLCEESLKHIYFWGGEGKVPGLKGDFIRCLLKGN